MNLKEKNDSVRARLTKGPDIETATAALNKEHTADTWYDYGMSFSLAKRREEAVNAYSQGLVEFPFSPMLYFGRGRQFMGKLPERAIADFTMAIQLDPDVNLFWYYRAVTNNLNGRYEQAIYDFTQSLRCADPTDSYGMVDWLFTSYVENGDMEGARKILDEVPDDLEVPDMDFDYKRRVQLYKGLVSPEELIDLEEIRKHVPDPNDDLHLDIITLMFGKYIYYLYKDEQKKADEVLLEMLKNPYEGAFASSKAKLAAKARGLI